MKRTAAAEAFLLVFRQMYSEQALAPVIARGEEVARKVGAQMLGRGHLRLALEEIAREVEDEFEEDADGGL